MFEKITQAIIQKGNVHRILLPLCMLALCALFGVKAIIHAPATLRQKTKDAAGHMRNHTGFACRPARRALAMLLAVCMMLTMNGGFAFASEGTDGADVAIGTSSVGDVTDSGNPNMPGEPGTPNETECTCPPVDSGEIVHGKDCPLYVAPAEPVVPEKKCVCTVLCTAETVNAQCPICAGGFESCAYAAPMPSEATNAVYALIDALPTLAELEAVDTEGEDFPAYIEKLQADVEAARAAYGALTDEEKAAFDPARLQKLEGIEGLFAVSLMAVVGSKPSGDGTQSNPWQVTNEAELVYAMKPENQTTMTAPSYAKIMNPFTVSETIALGKKQPIYLDGNGQEITYNGNTALSSDPNYPKAGLFDVLNTESTFEIKNLGLNAQISGHYTVGRYLKVGALFAQMRYVNAVNLTNCYVRGEISARATLTDTNNMTGINIAAITNSHQDVQLDLKNVAVDVVPTAVNWYTNGAASFADSDRSGTASFAVSSFHYGTGATSLANCWFKDGNALYSESVLVKGLMGVGTPINTASGAGFYSDLQDCVDRMNTGIAADKDESFNTWEIKDGHLAFGDKWKAELKMEPGNPTFSGRVASFNSFSISSPGGSDLKSVSVQLTGRQPDDALALAAENGFTAIKNDDGSRLTLTGSGSDAAWTAELKKLQITLGTGETARSLRFEADASSSAISSDAVYNRTNGHYYKTISADSYAAGKTAAESAVLNLGTNPNQQWKGYLATVTDQVEQDFVRGAFGAVFIGASSDYALINATGKVTPGFTYNGDSWTNAYASSAASQGKYYWVSGPEAGTPIWRQTAPKPRFTDQQMAGEKMGGAFTAFAAGKPNNYRTVNNSTPEHSVPLEICEDERHLATTPDGWDDKSDTVLKTYLVEFGGRDAGETGASVDSFKAVNATITPSGMTTDTTPDPTPVVPTPPSPAAPARVC